MSICWTIAGSDSGGGAGIQADLKTFNRLGVHGCTVIASITAQNTRAVRAVAYPSLSMIEAQLDALAEDLPAAAVKTGMLGRADIMKLVAKRLSNVAVPVICDPVMLATSGGILMEPEAKNALIHELLPCATVLTPNLAEAAVLAEMPVDSPAAMVNAANRILALGPKSVLLKGGHASGEFAQDFWTDGIQQFWLTSPRIEKTHTHGSGCTLSAALAAAMAQGYAIEDALVIAKAYINQAIRHSQKLGDGAGPVVQLGWPLDPLDLPILTKTAQQGLSRPKFHATGPAPLGFYPIVDSSDWLARLLPLGVQTVQLRIKDLDAEALEAEIVRSIALARKYGARLFINDYWALAIKHGAYGVHLGQEDLLDADVSRLADAGLRLGISTHCYAEVARAHALRPSYLAIGPIYPTTTKVMRFGPQGLAALKRWRACLRYPLVAIGGINKARATKVLAAGADAVAVISAIANASNPESEASEWLARLNSCQGNRQESGNMT